MTKTFFCSDHHFGHGNILTFKDYNGCPTREFKDLEDMHEALITFHNEVVGPNDKVYFLGDVAINRKSIELVSKMNGRKVLVKGNHDIFKPQDYLNVFEDLRAFKVFPEQGIICSHIPLHPSGFEKGSRWVGNVHGHLHTNLVRLPSENKDSRYDHTNPPDPRYLNVSVEQINYTPIDFNEVVAYFNSIKGES